MKNRFFQYLMFILTVVALTQMVATPYVNCKAMGNMEIPVEEASDEDTDNEGEFDKVIARQVIENSDLSYSINHHPNFEASLQELIQEIVPPPPKARA